MLTILVKEPPKGSRPAQVPSPDIVTIPHYNDSAGKSAYRAGEAARNRVQAGPGALAAGDVLHPLHQVFRGRIDDLVRPAP